MGAGPRLLDDAFIADRSIFQHTQIHILTYIHKYTYIYIYIHIILSYIYKMYV